MRAGDRELWFIHSRAPEDWAGLRVATFMQAINDPDVEIVVIHNECIKRTGPRIWNDIVEREGWVKVEKIECPSPDKIVRAHG